PWYGRETFQVLFSIVLFGIALRMLRGGDDHPDGSEKPHTPPLKLLGVGTAAGSLSSGVGVGGGVVLVPMYERLIRLPIRTAMGTSSATIILITLFGVLSYALKGEGVVGATSAVVGFVDFGAAALLAVPAAITAGYGVRLSHGINRTLLRRVFAVLVLLVALRLVFGVVSA
ncbi:MAG: TSUP family transporter, partial [Rhodothermales bacterium]|nr:TSUP family transporter [Rhodothermales bacterium]